MVAAMKSRLAIAIGKSCDEFSSELFLLTFHFFLVSTAPEIGGNLDSELDRSAVSLGFSKSEFSKILKRLPTDPDGAVADFQEAVENLISERSGQSKAGIADAVELKPGIGGLTIDLKMLWKRASAFFRSSAGS
ncbi:MAG: hypothetical protein IH989_08715 [Planctomycetes bacterium]|nr:hypothetical protein [Planctomycetota bacterium]